jgi:hypothetical protein
LTAVSGFRQREGVAAPVGDGVAVVPGFANVIAFQTADGLVLVDTGLDQICLPRPWDAWINTYGRAARRSAIRTSRR